MKRCAIYTRKSTEERLDLRYNSLQAQRDACEAYISSQVTLGWELIQDDFNDGGFSGGTVDRPAFARLMAAVERHEIDVVVVHKIDRLTRSLSDFATLAKTFDNHGVSLVSITQSFDTSTSMGRLSLNVLLSFAQFEREIAGERIREKIAASRRKGFWTGGPTPTGYLLRNKALVVDELLAPTIQTYFSRYLALRSVTLLRKEIAARGAKTPSRGALYMLLRNPTYAGLLRSNGELFQGKHQPIVGADTWQAAQKLLDQNRRRSGPSSQGAEDSGKALLLGKLYDGAGRAITRSKTRSHGRTYHYYVSAASVQGGGAPARVRVPCHRLDQCIIQGIREWLCKPRTRATLATPLRDLPSCFEKVATLTNEAIDSLDQAVLAKTIESVALDENQIKIRIDPVRLVSIVGVTDIKNSSPDGHFLTLTLANMLARSRRTSRSILRGHLKSQDLVDCGRKWAGLLINGQAKSMDEIARREKCSQATVSRAVHAALTHVH